MRPLGPEHLEKHSIKDSFVSLHWHLHPIALIKENPTGKKLPNPGIALISRTTVSCKRYMATHCCGGVKLNNGRGWFRLLFDEEGKEDLEESRRGMWGEDFLLSQQTSVLSCDGSSSTEDVCCITMVSSFTLELMIVAPQSSQLYNCFHVFRLSISRPDKGEHYSLAI